MKLVDHGQEWRFKKSNHRSIEPDCGEEDRGTEMKKAAEAAFFNFEKG
jgi:hypothetical protein